MQLNNAAELASGCWHGILTALGVPQEFLYRKAWPCPICGGKDRFRFDNKTGAERGFVTNAVPVTDTGCLKHSTDGDSSTR